MTHVKTVVNWILLTACLLSCSTGMAEPALGPSEAQAIAREAFVYAVPLVLGYETLHKQSVDSTGQDFRAPFNQLWHNRRAASPDDDSTIVPNADTLTSSAWLDLRSEPVVITLPTIDAGRYYSVQLVDLQTFNFAYLGTRTFGNDGGSFAIVGPHWKGKQPAGVRAVIRCETDFATAIFRTQLVDAGDIDRAHAIQDGYRIRSLSAFLGTKPAAPAPPIEWPPVDHDDLDSVAAYEYLNFLLTFSPTVPSEKALMQRFAKLNIGPGKHFDFDRLTPDLQNAISAGIYEAKSRDLSLTMAKVNSKQLSLGELYGSREFLKNNYVYRYAAARIGLYGHSREEASQYGYYVDGAGKRLNAAVNRYELRFEKDQLPPAGAFWSLTLYGARNQFLVRNSLQRYGLGSTMLDHFRYGEDGSLTLQVSKTSPGGDEEANWLPAPNDWFFMILRLYLPKEEALSGSWKPPVLKAIPLK